MTIDADIKGPGMPLILVHVDSEDYCSAATARTLRTMRLLQKRREVDK